MADRILVDTNVLLYAYDRGEPVKQPRALAILNSLVVHDLRVLSREILDITGAIVLEAVRGVHTHQMAYWDAQIWASARMNQIQVVFSEDFGEGTLIHLSQISSPQLCFFLH